MEENIENTEHIRAYNINHFDNLSFIFHGYLYDKVVFKSRGFTEYGINDLYYNIYLKNIFRPLFGRKKIKRHLQIIYKFKNENSISES